MRRIVAASGLAWSDPAPFDDEATLAEALLEPTRIYVKSILKAIRDTHGIKALAHITGGGFPENIPRVLPKDFSAELDLDAIDVPPVFSWLAKTGGVAPRRDDAHLQLRHRHGRRRWRPARRRRSPPCCRKPARR